MARIRSVFPGLFTDEAFAPLSDAAQITLIGLWTEADDNGVFEWKPVRLRMRLRPSKDGSVEPMLAELVGANVIMPFEDQGRHYGAVRNFKKYQRPKSPQAVHPLPDHIVDYVSGSGHGSDVTEGMDFPRDATAADRKARQRDREKRERQERESRDANGNGHGSNGADDGSCHGSAVTISQDQEDATAEPYSIPQNGEVSRQREEGGDSGKVSKNPPNPLRGVSPQGDKTGPTKRSRGKTKTGVPSGDRLQAVHLEFRAQADKRGLNPPEAEDQFERFIDHHRAKGSTFADWDAAGRTWLKNTVKFAIERAGHRGAGPPAARGRPNSGLTDFLLGKHMEQQHDGPTIDLDADDIARH